MKQIESLAVHIELTYSCNNRCFYCYNENHNPISMSMNKAKTLIQKIEDYVYTRSFPINIVITGGEPFENIDVLYYMYEKLSNIPNLSISINTNLANNDLTKIQELEKLKKQDEQIHFFVSIPSMFEGIYNKITCNTNYKFFIRNLEYILSKPEVFNIVSNIVVNNYNKDTLIKSIMLMKLIGINEFKMSPLKSKQTSNEIFTLLNKAIKFSKKLDMVFHGFATPFILTNKQKRSIDYQELKEYEIRNCGAGNTHFSITPQGFLTPCSAISSKHAFFNILETNNEFIPDIIRGKTYNLACTKECEEYTNS